MNWKLILTIVVLCQILPAADQPQWGEKFSRNMVSAEKNLPNTFDIESGLNVKWKAKLGSQTYSTPVVANGRVFIGTNNDDPRDPDHAGDRGVLYCLDEKSGELVWQLVVPKITTSRYWDWPREGICSPATVEGDRVYILSNRGEIMCLDIDGLSDGNDGPFQSEAEHMVPQGEAIKPLKPTDADIIWLYDLIKQSGVRQHDGAHSSFLIHGDYLYANTSNGVDDSHSFIEAPDAPSLVVLNKQSGQLVAQDNLKIGDRIFHCTWSSPALGSVGGKPQVYFGGGDGILYAFAAVTVNSPSYLEPLWSYDGDPAAPKNNVHDYMGNRQTSPSNIKSMPVVHNGRIYLTLGGDIWWGKRQSWLKCVDAGNGKELWSYAMNDHCCATPSVYNGLVFVGDTGGGFHCVDAETGEPLWSETLHGDIWASALAADGKVYIGTRRGEFYIFKADKQKQLLFSTRLDSKINATATAANGRLYVATMEWLYALGR